MRGAVIGDMRISVHDAPHAVPAEVQVDAVAVFVGHLADCSGYVSQTIAGLGLGYTGRQGILGGLDQTKVLGVGIITHHETDGRITDPPVDIDGQVKGKQVTVLEVIVKGNPVQDRVIDREADVVGEGAGAEVWRIIHVAGRGPLAGLNTLLDMVVQVKEIDTGLAHGLEFLEDTTDEPAGRLHLLDLLLGLQLNHACTSFRVLRTLAALDSAATRSEWPLLRPAHPCSGISLILQ